MTDPSTVSIAADSALDEEAMLYALGELSGADKARFESCLHCTHSPASRLVAEYQDLLATVATEGQAERVPDPEVKKRIIASIQRSASGHAAHEFMSSIQMIWGEDQPWRPTPYPGVRLKEVSLTSSEFAVLMLELAPGSSVPEHQHHGPEDLYLLSGDLQIEGESRLMQVGDFMHCEEGSRHRSMVSPSGCRALSITSRKNYSPTAMRAYGVVHGLVRRVREWRGAKSESASK